MRRMARLRVHSFSVSQDGYGAGPSQSLENPMGIGGHDVHEWVFSPDRTDAENELYAWGTDGIGATVMGRNMFGPVRGPWPDESWRGWWGDEPPYHHPVFVLTHHPRASFEMEGGTSFHFVTDGIGSALRQALDAAGGLDVRLGGGVSAVQQYLAAGLLDVVHLAVAPVRTGAGERLTDDVRSLEGMTLVRTETSPRAEHLVFERA
jgi:dihydrofolate reductase